MIKNLINKYFKHFAYFYSYLKNRIFFALLLSILVGLLDGIGLVFFLPLLSMSGGAESKNSLDSLEGFGFLGELINNLGLSISLGSVLLIILFVFILKNVIRLLEGGYSVNTQRQFVVKIRKECIALFRNYKYSAYTKADSGRIQNTLTGGIAGVVSGYRFYFLTLQNLVMVIVYIVMACVANFKFAILVFIGGLLTSFIFRFIYAKTKEISRRLTKNAHGFQGLLIQSVAFFKYLKSTGKMTGYSKNIENIIDTGEWYARRMGLINVFLSVVREPVVLAVLLSVVYLQVSVFGESMTSILISVMLFYRALNVMMVVQTNWNGFLQTTGALENLQDFMTELKTNAEVYGKTPFTNLQSELKLVNVSFNYEGGETILKQINLTISKNQAIAFVGESGSGKTTTVNLLAGLFGPVGGQYLIDGVNAHEFDIRQFQNRIGYITQESIIFDDTVFNNVTFWDKPTEENRKRFWVALNKAAVSKFVNELPEKENTRLGNNGVMVSGGQKQRISIARELYKDIDILIMDEATSALDSETEKAIQENIDALKGNYTIVIVAHRLSTIKNADEIVLMDKGRILDKGDFETLKNRNPNFNRMVNLQEI